jgi:DNA-directed RNA polymerase subunit RPC12/RpoP
MKLENYKCDRCGEEFSVPHNEFPDLVSIREASEIANPDIHDYELCSTCRANLAIFFVKQKEVDQALKPLWDA